MRYGVLAVAVIAGCGGGNNGSDIQLVGEIGGGDQVSPGSAGGAAGLWHGTTDTGRSASALLLSNGEYWLIYSAIGNSEVVAGAAQGTGTATESVFQSSNGRDFNLEAAAVESLSGTFDFVPRSTLSGASTYEGGGVVNFTATYDPAFELTPSLAAIAGDYAGEAASAAGNESAFFDISQAGVVDGQGSSGCHFSGSISPRTDGNAYSINVTFGSSPCIIPGGSIRGIAYYDEALQRLTSAGVNVARTSGFIFLGSKI